MALCVARVLSGTGFQVALVARDNHLADLGMPILVEPDGPIHPLSGVLAALEDVGPTGRALIAPCDLPGLDPASVALLLAGDPPRVAEGQPLLAWLPGEWAARVRTLRDAGAPARRLAEGAIQVSLATDALHNVNRLEDLFRS